MQGPGCFLPGLFLLKDGFPVASKRKRRLEDCRSGLFRER